jgi:solute carrier family 10 (sodium/bile acid cotransporter), member 7
VNGIFHFFRAHWFLQLLLVTLVIGFWFPGIAGPLAESPKWQRTLVASVIFVTSFPLGFGRWLRVAKSPGGVLLAVVVNAIFLPLLTWPIARGMKGELGIGLMVAMIVPSTVASATFLTQRAGGNAVITILTTPATNFASLVTIPFWLSVTGNPWVPTMDRGKVMGDIFWLVVMPMFLAQLVRLWSPVRQWLEERAPWLAYWAQIGILLMVMVGGYECARGMAGPQGSGVTWRVIAGLFLLVASMHLVSWALGFWLAQACGLPRGDAIGVAFGGSQKTLMVGLHLAILLGGGLAVLPMVAYHATQLVLGTILADSLARHPQPSP